MGDTVRTGFALMIAVAFHLPTLTRAQSGPADIEEMLVIPVHPSTPTTVQLRDAIVDAWINHNGEFLMEIVGQGINLRPRPDTPAGTEAEIVVETSTARRRFRLRVVERPEDAVQKIVLPAVKPAEPTERAGEARREVPPVVPAEPQPAAREQESEPWSTPAPPRPAAPPHAGNESAPAPARESAEPATGRGATADGAPAFDLSVHALVSLGVTALDVPGYEPSNARQPHGALGLRLTLAPQDTWWALEANVSGEWLAGSMVYVEENSSEIGIRGAWFRAEVGLRAQVGTRWIPTAYAGARPASTASD